MSVQEVATEGIDRDSTGTTSEATAADAASGRPEGVRKSDWRNFMRSPQGMMFGIQRQDQAAQVDDSDRGRG